MSSIFPQEILDLFVDEAASDRSYNSHRVDTLKSCSLVCKSISRTARSHIFSDITIDYNFMVDRRGSAKFSKIEDLWHALERDQRLASRVRVFQLNLIKRIEWPKNPRPAHMAIVACWEGIDQVVLPGIMSTLSRTQPKLVPGTYKGRLHTMSLGGYGGAILSWNDLRFDFQREWCMLYALSEITCLRIGSMDDFPVPRALALKPNLRRLEILADDSKSMPRTFLDSFRWKIPIPTNLSSFPALEELECMLILEQWPDRDFCTELIENCASSLRSLKIVCPSYLHQDTDILPSLDLASLPVLKNLTLEIRDIDSGYIGDFVYIANDLLRCASPNTLHTLRLDIITQAKPDFEDCWHERTKDIFNYLDIALSGKVFGNLREVCIRALCSSEDQFDFPTNDPSLLSPDVQVMDLLYLLPRTSLKLDQKNIAQYVRTEPMDVSS